MLPETSTTVHGFPLQETNQGIPQGGTWETFERILKRAGYFQTGLRKIEVARAIAEHMDPSRNASPSFQAVRHVLATMTLA